MIHSPSTDNSPIKGLYAITDPSLISDEALLNTVKEAITGGASIIQYRNKRASTKLQQQQAQQLSQLCKKHQVCFIINDDPELARLVNADGVHVGKDDGKIADARKLLGNHAIIGVSCYNRLENAHKAIEQGASYVAFGRFFPSRTKPNAIQAELELLEAAAKELTIPFVAIGGITRNNAAQLIHRGAHAVAVINDLFHDKQAVHNTAKEYKALFDE